ncbi:MAG TPA: hypothetical protein VJU87_03605 [Gemmatimonadaceae bacterium]|nr:hypothetical protein [Gemmatimonadaceae bacterium]
MSIVPFDTLPDESRVWVFGSDRRLQGDDAERLLADVDRFLAGWKAHGVPLRCARAWTEDHFLTIGVDTTIEGASGCSIDGLFRSLQQLERALGTRLVAGGRVFYRDGSGQPRAVARDEFSALAERGEISADTAVFDTSLTRLGDWRERFEQPAAAAWTAQLLAR